MLLRKTIQNEEASLSDIAKTFWESNPAYRKNKLDNIRTKFKQFNAKDEQVNGKQLLLWKLVLKDDCIGV